MRRLYIIVFLFLLSGCSLIQPGKQKKDVLFSIDSTQVSADEFIYNLKKNNYESDSVFNIEEINEYLDLYVNFKLKVKDAFEQGLDTTDSFIEEYSKYKDQLTESYMKDDSIVELLVFEAYNRMLIEINASHILITVQNFYNPADTLVAFNKIYDIHNQLLSGEDFETLAVRYSNDPSAKINKGNLGYFSGLQMVYPFEEMAFNTPINEFSTPFKTRFGYHIVKVNDKRKARGKVEAAHIMIRWPPNASIQDSLHVKNKINLIYDSLNSGGNWNSLCLNFSDDQNTKNSGGVLQPFEAGRIVPSFGEAAFALNNPGDISKPVMTPYGWHIIKLIDKIQIQSFEDLKDDLYTRVKNDSRSELTRTALINRLKKENNFILFHSVKSKCVQYADSSLLLAKWSYDSLDPFLNTNIFKINSRNYSVSNFFQYVSKNQIIIREKSPGMYMFDLLEKYIEKSLIDYEKEHLAEKNYNYRMLVREYKEGILLFDLMEREVWNKATQDSIGLEEYFINNQTNYMWENERIDALIISTTDIKHLNEAKSITLKSYFPIDNDSILFNYPVLESQNNGLEKFFSIVQSDTTLKLELSTPLNWESRNEFIEFSNNNAWDTSKLIFKTGISSKISLKIVSNAKKYLEKTLNEKSDLNLLVESGIYEKGSNEIVDIVEWEVGSFDLSIEDTESYIIIYDIISPGPKILEEVKGRVIGDYQDFLEKKWIEELKLKYSVSINEKVLTKIYHRFEN